MKYLCKVILYALAFFIFQSCYVQRTYKLKRYYSERKTDPDRKILDAKIDNLICQFSSNCFEEKHCTSVNGRYITFKVRKNCVDNLDQFFMIQLCEQRLAGECEIVEPKKNE